MSEKKEKKVSKMSQIEQMLRDGISREKIVEKFKMKTQGDLGWYIAKLRRADRLPASLKIESFRSTKKTTKKNGKAAKAAKLTKKAAPKKAASVSTTPAPAEKAAAL